MAKKDRTDYVNRNSILSLLSVDETARLSDPEAGALLAAGDEFIDLVQLARGVQFAGTSTPAESTLPRKAVHESTWNKIVKSLPSSRR